MHSKEAQVNQTELMLALAEMASRIKGLVTNGIICKQYAQELWELHVRTVRRSYIFAEDIGVEIIKYLTEHVKAELPPVEGLMDGLQSDYMTSIGDGIPLIPDENLWLEGEEPENN